jgi:hypothetical protein
MKATAFPHHFLQTRGPESIDSRDILKLPKNPLAIPPYTLYDPYDSFKGSSERFIGMFGRIPNKWGYFTNNKNSGMRSITQDLFTYYQPRKFVEALWKSS